MIKRKLSIIGLVLLLLSGCNNTSVTESQKKGVKFFEELIEVLDSKENLYTKYEDVWLPNNFYEYVNVEELQNSKVSAKEVVVDYFGWDYGYKTEKGIILINVEGEYIKKLSVIPLLDLEKDYSELKSIINPFIVVMNEEFNMLLGTRYEKGKTIEELREEMKGIYTSLVIEELINEITKEQYLFKYNSETKEYYLETRETIQKNDVYGKYEIISVIEESEERVEVIILGEYVYESINYHQYFEETVILIKEEGEWKLGDILKTNKEAVRETVEQ